MKIELPKYTDKSELFAYLKKHERDIFSLKKSEMKKCDAFGVTVFEQNISKSVIVAKAHKAAADTADVIRKTIVGNTYNWLDSHDDMHVEGIFTKSIQESKAYAMHLHDHLNMVAAKVGVPVDVYEERTNWVDLGVGRTGDTVCLCMDSDVVKDMNPSIFYQYKNNQIDQHSVGMIYVTLFLCIDSNDPQYKAEKANWQKYFPKLGNPEKASEQGYFFAVTEAKLIEISAVTKGSNELTPTKHEAAAGTSGEPEKSTQKNALTWEHLKSIQI